MHEGYTFRENDILHSIILFFLEVSRVNLFYAEKINTDRLCLQM